MRTSPAATSCRTGEGWRHIARDQPVLELETDKATIEVPSLWPDVVKDIKVKQGDKVKVGAVILTVDENGAGGAPKPAEAQTHRRRQRRPATGASG